MNVMNAEKDNHLAQPKQDNYFIFRKTINR